MFAVLRKRNFALLWFGQLVSMIGDWVLIVALPFYIYQRTGSTLATGTMFIVEVLPRLFFGSVAGVFVDRWDRRRTMIAADLSRSLILLPLLLVHSPDWLWLIYLVGFVESFLSQFFSPAQAAFIPHLVEEEQLTAANSANSLGQELTRLIGPTLGGFLLALLGLNSVVLVDSASFVFSALMLLLISVRSVRPIVPSIETAFSTATAANVWGEWLEGLRLVRNERLIATLFIVMWIALVGEGTGRAVSVPFLSTVAGGNALVFGWIMTAQGMGGIAGALLNERIRRIVQPTCLIAFGAMGAGLLVMIEVMFPLLPVVLTFTALAGAPVVFFFVGVYTLLQRNVADRYRGRIFGAYYTTNTVLLLVGMALSSVLGGQSGARPMFFAMGLLYFLAGVTALLPFRNIQVKPSSNSNDGTVENLPCEPSASLLEDVTS
jgi:MFS family permease